MKRSALPLIWWTALLLCASSFSHAQQGPAFPTLTGRVVDSANIIDADVEATIADQLEAYETDTTTQIVVVTVDSLGGYDIADYANKLGRHWEIGTAEHDNGVLLVVSKNDRKVRIEVGYGLEGALTDATSSDIIRSKILPQFREEDYGGGVQMGIQSILEAIKGEYVATPASRSVKSKDGGPPAAAIPLLFFALIAIRGVLTKFKIYSAAEQAIPAGFIGVLVTIISGNWIWGVVAGLGLFVVLMIFNRGKIYDGTSRSRSNRRDSSHGPFGGSGGFSSSGGGFSGGGGSFGGGGASGSW